MDVEVLELGRQAVHLAEDRRQRELDRLQQREALLEDQALEQAVEVLAVRAVARDRQAELLALLPQLGDGVDLAVVAEDRERLDPAEGGVGVRGVAVVGDDPRRGEVGLQHLRVEARDHLGLALDLVDGVVGRERGHVAVERRARSPPSRGSRPSRRRPPGSRGQAGDLPEDRRRLGGPRAQRAAVNGALAAPQHLEAVRRHDGLDAGHLALGPVRRVEEDVGDREAPVVGGGRVEALGLQPAAPRRPRQVHHQPAAVALAVHAPGAVDHHLQRRRAPAPASPCSAARRASRTRRARRRRAPPARGGRAAGWRRTGEGRSSTGLFGRVSGGAC